MYLLVTQQLKVITIFLLFFRSQAKLRIALYFHTTDVFYWDLPPLVFLTIEGQKKLYVLLGRFKNTSNFAYMCVEYISNTVDTLIEYKSFFCGIATAQKSS